MPGALRGWAWSSRDNRKVYQSGLGLTSAVSVEKRLVLGQCRETARAATGHERTHSDRKFIAFERCRCALMMRGRNAASSCRARSSYAAFCCMSCPRASSGFAITGCWPRRVKQRAWRKRGRRWACPSWKLKRWNLPPILCVEWLVWRCCAARVARRGD